MSAKPDVYDEIETWDQERVDAFASERLRTQIEYVMANSAFYQEKFRGLDVASKVKSVADLEDLPLTDKPELRESLARRPPLGDHLAAPMSSLTQIQATSGTSGAPSYFGLTPHDLDVWAMSGSRVLYAAGIRPGDLLLHGWGLSKGFAGGVPGADIMRKFGAIVLPIGGESGAERLLTIIRAMRPTAFCSGPNFALHVGQAAEMVLGMPARELGVARLLVGGEPGGGEQRLRGGLESVWAATSCECLGNSDLVPTAFGECLERNGMHFLGHGVVHMEIIDPAAGTPLPIESGVVGELVLTALDREASPLIRFRTRDQIEVLDTECACGRTGPKVRCTGRTDDMLIVRGINVWPAAIRDVVAEFQPDLTGNMRIIKDFDGHATSSRLRLRVEYSDAHGRGEADALAHRLEQRVAQRLAFKPAVEMVATGVLGEYAANKTNLIIDEMAEAQK